MRLKLYAAIILAAAMAFAACNAVDQAVNTNHAPPKAPAGPETTYADGARRITPAELDTLMKDGKVLVLDVRNQQMYDVGHIPGSKLIPAADVANHLDELPKDKMIVTYCS